MLATCPIGPLDHYLVEKRLPVQCSDTLKGHSEAARMTAGPRYSIFLALNKQMEVWDWFLPAKLPAEG